MHINFNTTDKEIENMVENLQVSSSEIDKIRQKFYQVRNTLRALEDAKKVSPELLKMRINV